METKELNIGTKVYHIKYGSGTITQIKTDTVFLVFEYDGLKDRRKGMMVHVNELIPVNSNSPVHIKKLRALKHYRSRVLLNNGTEFVIL